MPCNLCLYNYFRIDGFVCIRNLLEFDVWERRGRRGILESACLSVSPCVLWLRLMLKKQPAILHKFETVCKFLLSLQAKRKLELDCQNEGFKTPAKSKRQRTKSDQSPKGMTAFHRVSIGVLGMFKLASRYQTTNHLESSKLRALNFADNNINMALVFVEPACGERVSHHNSTALKVCSFVHPDVCLSRCVPIPESGCQLLDFFIRPHSGRVLV